MGEAELKRIEELEAELDRDSLYVKDTRNRLDRAHERINDLTLCNSQQSARIKILETQIQTLEKLLFEAADLRTGFDRYMRNCE